VPVLRTAPYVDLDRAAWSRLDRSDLALGREELAGLVSLGDPVDTVEVDEVYLSLARLLLLQAHARRRLQEATAQFLGGAAPRQAPFVVGIAGSVAAGKSTTARVLRALLARAPGEPRVELVSTDGFLLPNAELSRRGLMERKGWPESYDTGALLRFLAAVKAGARDVPAPVYSHLVYDVVPGATTVVDRPDVLLVEGLTVLQPAVPPGDGRARMVASDFFDSSLFVDAREPLLARWYVERFLTLRDTAFQEPGSYFARYAGMSDEQASETALRIWQSINRPNLERNILPTRGRAAIVLEKGPDHRVERVRLRAL
jgi:type I pantothenate kinase